MSAIVKWTGASGRKYPYHAWSISTRPGSRDEEGNYIFAKIAGGFWIPSMSDKELFSNAMMPHFEKAVSAPREQPTIMYTWNTTETAVSRKN